MHRMADPADTTGAAQGGGKTPGRLREGILWLAPWIVVNAAWALFALAMVKSPKHLLYILPFDALALLFLAFPPRSKARALWLVTALCVAGFLVQFFLVSGRIERTTNAMEDPAHFHRAMPYWLKVYKDSPEGWKNDNGYFKPYRVVAEVVHPDDETIQVVRRAPVALREPLGDVEVTLHWRRKNGEPEDSLRAPLDRSPGETVEIRGPVPGRPGHRVVWHHVPMTPTGFDGYCFASIPGDGPGRKAFYYFTARFREGSEGDRRHGECFLSFPYFAHLVYGGADARNRAWFPAKGSSEGPGTLPAPDAVPRVQDIFYVTFERRPDLYLLWIHVVLNLVALAVWVHSFYFAHRFLQTGAEGSLRRAHRSALWGLAVFFLTNFTLGCFVAWQVFDDAYGGYPFGLDITDNKTAVTALFFAVVLFLEGRRSFDPADRVVWWGNLALQAANLALVYAFVMKFSDSWNLPGLSRTAMVVFTVLYWAFSAVHLRTWLSARGKNRISDRTFAALVMVGAVLAIAVVLIPHSLTPQSFLSEP